MARRKWELIQEDVKRREVTTNPLWGVVSEGTVYVDVYRKLKRNGTYKFKTVKR